MTIPASHIVEVNPRVINGGSADLAINGLIYSKNALIPASRMVLEFANADSVGAYFGLASDEYKSAIIYFNGYTNKQASPQSLFFALRIDEAIAARLIGAKVLAPVSQLKNITTGAMKITVNGTEQTLTALTFATANSYSDIATALQTAITGVTVEYSSLTGGFIITTSSTGANATITVATGDGTSNDVSGLLGLSANAGAVASDGSAALSVTENMTAVLAKTQNWVSFTTLWEADYTEALQWAEWANGHYGWLYVDYTTNAATPSQSSTTDPASKLLEAGYDNTAIVYGNRDYAVFIMGTAASISWARINGTITFAFKKQSGLVATVSTIAEATALEAKKCNYYGNFATRNAQFEFLYPACLVHSDYGFIDPLVNSIWLNNKFQVCLMDGITGVGRAPYNERGYALIRAWMMTAINVALKNGAIDKGLALSDTQKAQIITEAGKDISNELYTEGYYIQILDPDAQTRAQRGTPVINLWYTYAGAVQKISVASTAVL